MAAGLDVTIAELYRTFHAANSRFYKNALPEPTITVQTAGRLSAFGWCTTREIWRGGQGGRYEINISAEYLQRGPVAVAETLLHEMVHLHNLAVAKIRDVSGHQYHNRHFKQACEEHGLTAEKMGRYGFAKTDLMPATREWLESLGLSPAAFAMGRQGGKAKGGDGGGGGSDDGGEQDGTKGKLKRWACHCTNVRCATELVATCGQCGQPFILGAKAQRPKADDNDED